MGWGYNQFKGIRRIQGAGYDFVESGYTLGIKLDFPIKNSPIDFYFRAGGTYDNIETENHRGDILHDTGHSLG